MIDIINLTITYQDGTKALADLTFSVREGERVAVIGANGAGKSTLLLSVVGVVPISHGSVVVDSVPVTSKSLAEVRRKAGMVFQNPDDQLFMTKVYDDVAFGLRNYGASEEELSPKVHKSLESLGISHLADRMPHRLSGGEKRRVAIAGVLAMEPSVILMDEPTSFLDPCSRRLLIKTLTELPHTLLIATHDLDMAAQTCDRVLALKNGALLASGTPEKILSDEVLLKDCGL